MGFLFYTPPTQAWNYGVSFDFLILPQLPHWMEFIQPMSLIL